jgi:hypothetical protein
LFPIAQRFEISLGSRNPDRCGDIDECEKVVTDWKDPALEFCAVFDFITYTAGISAKSARRILKLHVILTAYEPKTNRGRCKGIMPKVFFF